MIRALDRVRRAEEKLGVRNPAPLTRLEASEFLAADATDCIIREERFEATTVCFLVGGGVAQRDGDSSSVNRLVAFSSSSDSSFKSCVSNSILESIALESF